MALRHLILKILHSSPVALTVYEICCAVNRKPMSYCQNVDGRGNRCIWLYRRGDGVENRYQLVKPDCTYTALYVINVLQDLYRRGLVKKMRVKMRDPMSIWGRDYFVLVYVREEQLTRRLRQTNRTILDYITPLQGPKPALCSQT